MIELVDVGSMPYLGDSKIFSKAYKAYSPSLPSQSSDLAKYFEAIIIETFIDKLKAGFDIPNYPQFRDMNYMFLESIHGLEKVKGGFMEVNDLSIIPDKNQIAEVAAIKNNIEQIFEKVGHPIRLKICITGPYTLSNFFTYKDS
ncbi:MAG: hypothetical protein ACFFDN_33110, partial [Candidatus Hodarchaeota archaeon]